MKSLSLDGIGETLLRAATAGKRPTAHALALLFFLDETDVAAALESSQLDAGDVLGFRVEAEIFLEIVLRNEVVFHFLPIDFAIPDQGDRLPFDELSERMRFASAEGKDAVDDHQRDAAGDGDEKRRGAVNRAGQHRANQDDEDRVEGGLLRERAPVADTDQRETDNENNETAKRNVEDRQFGRLAVGAEKNEEKILERVHEKISPRQSNSRVSKRGGSAINPSPGADSFSCLNQNLTGR